MPPRKVHVCRDDGRIWASSSDAEDELWLKYGTVREACRTGKPLLGHRYRYLTEREGAMAAFGDGESWVDLSTVDGGCVVPVKASALKSLLGDGYVVPLADARVLEGDGIVDRACSACGRPVSPGDSFCSGCGRALTRRG